jgi:hypothetical protein
MHPMPEAVASMDGLQGLKFVKGKDKVFLVRPSTGTCLNLKCLPQGSGAMMSTDACGLLRQG